MKKNLHLWITFTITIVAITIANFMLIGMLAFFFFRSNMPPSNQTGASFSPFFGLIISSIIISTTMTVIVSRRFFIPIEELNKALKKVAAGDFSVRLPERNSELELHSMNVNFNKMVKELNSIEMLQSDFIQNVSHEFKTPLASIEGYATLLADSELPDELHKYTGKILISTRQLSALTGNILHLSKLENQQIISEKQLYSLDEQLRQSILSLEPLWSRKNLEIDLNLPEVSYFGNAPLMYQVWTNLFSNAIKFTPEHGTISVIISTDQSGISVTVRDTGIGMTEDVRKHIFDKFYQEAHSRNVEGNGLGLSLVKKIVTLCNGEIRVESSPDGGSAFMVWLPKE